MKNNPNKSMTFYLLLTTFCCALAVFQSGYSSSSLNVTQKIVENFIQEVFEKRFDVETCDAVLVIVTLLSADAPWSGLFSLKNTFSKHSNSSIKATRACIKR